MTPVTKNEARKYSEIWKLDAYHGMSPGVQMIEVFKRFASPARGASVIDVGAGAGAGSRALAALGLKVTAFDLTASGWRGEDEIPLVLGSVWNDLKHSCQAGFEFDFAYCTDVMEHIPTEFVALSIARILEVSRAAFFSVSFKPDAFGAFINEPLHLTVRPFVWWRDVFREICSLQHAIDLQGEGVFYVERK